MRRGPLSPFLIAALLSLSTLTLQAHSFPRLPLLHPRGNTDSNGAKQTDPGDGCIVTATAGSIDLLTAQNTITVSLKLPASHIGGEVAHWESVYGLQWQAGLGWPEQGPAYIESEALEYGFEAKVFAPGSGNAADAGNGYFHFQYADWSQDASLYSAEPGNVQDFTTRRNGIDVMFPCWIWDRYTGPSS